MIEMVPTPLIVGSPKVVKYRLIESCPEELAGIVQSYIVEGWQPFGPPPAFERRGYTAAFQAMVRYEGASE